MLRKQQLGAHFIINTAYRLPQNGSAKPASLRGGRFRRAAYRSRFRRRSARIIANYAHSSIVFGAIEFSGRHDDYAGDSVWELSTSLLSAFGNEKVNRHSSAHGQARERPSQQLP